MSERNKEIEDRIDMDIVVDAYDPEERAMGWYYYISENCSFPFKATCIAKCETSPLNVGEIIEVLDTASGEYFLREVLVKIKWNNREFAVPLEQLEAIDVDEETQQVLGDWAYWCSQGYEY